MPQGGGDGADAGRAVEGIRVIDDHDRVVTDCLSELDRLARNGPAGSFARWEQVRIAIDLEEVRECNDRRTDVGLEAIVASEQGIRDPVERTRPGVRDTKGSNWRAPKTSMVGRLECQDMMPCTRTEVGAEVLIVNLVAVHVEPLSRENRHDSEASVGCATAAGAAAHRMMDDASLMEGPFKEFKGCRGPRRALQKHPARRSRRTGDSMPEPLWRSTGAEQRHHGR